jgi:hypothetical protein
VDLEQVEQRESSAGDASVSGRPKPRSDRRFYSGPPVGNSGTTATGPGRAVRYGGIFLERAGSACKRLRRGAGCGREQGDGQVQDEAAGPYRIQRSVLHAVVLVGQFLYFCPRIHPRFIANSSGQINILSRRDGQCLECCGLGFSTASRASMVR